MEFEGVFSAIAAAVLISFGVGGDWARWTNVRNVSAPAQVASHVPAVAYKGPGRFHDNTLKHGKSSFLIKSASWGAGSSPRTEIPSIGFCPGAYHWTFSPVDGSRSSGVTVAGNYFLQGQPDDKSEDLLIGKPAE
jgi:hypothetical protein